MRVLWVQHWTVMPVIVEDREMAEEAAQRGRLPASQHMDLSSRNDLIDTEGPSPHRTCLISSGSQRSLPIHRQYRVSYTLLTWLHLTDTAQRTSPPAQGLTRSASMAQLLSNKCRGVNHSVCLGRMWPVISRAAGNHQVPSECHPWSEHCLSTNQPPPGIHRHTINRDI